jgi:hypothetical protein
MKRLIAASALAIYVSAVFAVSSVAATTWTTIARAQSSGNSGAKAGSALSSRPLELRIELVTANTTSAYIFWTETCSANKTPSVHYGYYSVASTTTNYHSLVIPPEVTWCSVVWIIEETSGTVKMYLQKGTSASSSRPLPVKSSTNVVIFSCTGNAFGVDATYGNNSSDHQGPSTVPWSMTLPLNNNAQYYDVVAQLSGSGNITCSVTVRWGGHSVTKTDSAHGGYNIVDPEVCSDSNGGWEAC